MTTSKKTKLDLGQPEFEPPSWLDAQLRDVFKGQYGAIRSALSKAIKGETDANVIGITDEQNTVIQQVAAALGTGTTNTNVLGTKKRKSVRLDELAEKRKRHRRGS